MHTKGYRHTEIEAEDSDNGLRIHRNTVVYKLDGKITFHGYAYKTLCVLNSL